jgi:hypothetical protein
MVDRFDLENDIMQCWQIINDIALMEEQGAKSADMVSLASVYEYKFKKLWSTFEDLVHEKKLG